MRALAFLIALFSLPAAPAADAVLRDAWIALPPPGARVVAAYLVLDNRSTTALRVVGAQAAGFARAEVHESYREGAQMKMQSRPALDVAAGATVSFVAGGLHLMLWEPAAPLIAGRHHELTLVLADGRRLTTRAIVRDPRTTSPDADHHNHH